MFRLSFLTSRSSRRARSLSHRSGQGKGSSRRSASADSARGLPPPPSAAAAATSVLAAAEATTAPRVAKAFGVPLTEAPGVSEDTGVPACVEYLCDVLMMQRSIDTSMIFRKTAPRDQVRALVRELDAESTPTSLPSPHVAACVLKRYLKELPDAPMADEHYQAWLEVGESGRASHARRVLHKLPAENVDLLARVMRVMSSIAAQHKVNMMSSRALAIVLMPSFFHHVMAPERERNFQIAVLELMIRRYRDVFEAPVRSRSA